MDIQVHESPEVPERELLVAVDHVADIVGLFLVEKDTCKVIRREGIVLSTPDSVVLRFVGLMLEGLSIGEGPYVLS